MSRIRYVKPGLFLNEELAALPPITRYIFVGLWCIADREGRLEDRPKRIKAEVIPYDRHNVEPHLEALATAGFIARYEVDGKRCIQIANWGKHQRPHPHEPASTVPAVPDSDEETPSSDKVVLGSDIVTPETLGYGVWGMGNGDGDNTPVVPRDPDGDFAEWYEPYPNKREPSKARLLYQFWCSAGFSADQLAEARDRYVRDCELNDRPLKYPATFLSKTGVWRDWLVTTPTRDTRGNGRGVNAEALAHAYDDEQAALPPGDYDLDLEAEI